MRLHHVSKPFRATNTDTKRPVSVTVTLTGANANAMVLLSRKGAFVDRRVASAGGVVSFYDLDDSDDFLYYASESGSTKAWSVSIEVASVVVTSLSAGGGSYGWVG